MSHTDTALALIYVFLVGCLVGHAWATARSDRVLAERTAAYLKGLEAVRAEYADYEIRWDAAMARLKEDSTRQQTQLDEWIKDWRAAKEAA
jgi:hypothetical protein